jgi:predicted nucleic acid-binding protein
LTCLRDHLPPGPLILDTSVVINLLGTREMTAIVAGVGYPSIIEERTLREVLRHPIPGTHLEDALSELRSKGLLVEVRMTQSEYETYLAVGLGPGESAAIAIAGRASSLVLDDRLARRHAAAMTTAPALGSSLTLILTSVYRSGQNAERARALVEAALTNARMGVPRVERSLLEETLRIRVADSARV